MTPSWYDLLGVDPDAPAEEVRVAWREAVADLDPTDRRFAVLNRAARVLLDPERRAAYDAELAARDDEEDGDDEPDPDEEAVATVPAVPPVATPASLREDAAEPDTAEPDTAEPDAVEPPAVEPDAGEPDAGEEQPDPSDEPEPAVVDRGDRTPPASLTMTVLAGVAAVALLVIAVLAWTQSTDTSDLEEGVAAARVAAEQAVVPVLSYDATDLEAGRSAATSYLTDDFREQYEQLFDGLIEGNAAEIGARVETTFVSSAVVRSDTDGERVQVLLFFDQATTNETTTEPRVASNQATFTMERVDDRWLVDDIETGFGD